VLLLELLAISPSSAPADTSLREQFPECPYVIGNASLDSRRNPDCLMHATEIVIREVQSANVFQIVEFLGIAVRQTRATKRHPNRKVAALHLACGDLTRVRPTVPYFYYRLYHRSGRIAPCGVILAVIALSPSAKLRLPTATGLERAKHAAGFADRSTCFRVRQQWPSRKQSRCHSGAGGPGPKLYRGDFLGAGQRILRRVR
jgi:hypothetical protein